MCATVFHSFLNDKENITNQFLFDQGQRPETLSAGEGDDCHRNIAMTLTCVTETSVYNVGTKYHDDFGVSHILVHVFTCMNCMTADWLPHA